MKLRIVIRLDWLRVVFIAGRAHAPRTERFSVLPSDQHGIVMTFGYDHGADDMLYGALSDTGPATIQRNDRPLDRRVVPGRRPRFGS
jgi:hypothetical protein